jgi:hypothetical protein
MAIVPAAANNVAAGGHNTQERAQPTSGRTALTENVITKRYALVADKNARAGDERANFVLALAAERAVHLRLWHDRSP